MSESQEQGLSALLNETRTFPPPEHLAKEANAQPGIYAEAQADPLAFWELQARRLTWAEPWSQVLDWDPPFARWFVGGKLNVAVNCVDRHVDGGPGRSGGLPLGGRAGRHPHDHLRRPARLGLPGRQRPDASWACGPGDKVAIYLPMIPEAVVSMLACARLGRSAHRRLRRLLLRRPAQPHPRLRRPLRRSPPTAATAAARRARSSPRSTRPCASAPTSSTRPGGAAHRAGRRLGRRAATCGGTRSWTGNRRSTPPRPSTPSTRSTSCTPAGRRPSRRASSTRAAATSPTSRRRIASSSTSSPRRTSSGRRPTSAG